MNDQKEPKIELSRRRKVTGIYQTTDSNKMSMSDEYHRKRLKEHRQIRYSCKTEKKETQSPGLRNRKEGLLGTEHFLLQFLQCEVGEGKGRSSGLICNPV